MIAQLLSAIYEEVCRIVSASAHKSTIVLCGSIAEALLIEQLMRDAPRAKAEAATLKIRHQRDPLDEWDLGELGSVDIWGHNGPDENCNSAKQAVGQDSCPSA